MRDRWTEQRVTVDGVHRTSALLSQQHRFKMAAASSVSDMLPRKGRPPLSHGRDQTTHLSQSRPSASVGSGTATGPNVHRQWPEPVESQAPLPHRKTRLMGTCSSWDAHEPDDTVLGGSKAPLRICPACPGPQTDFQTSNITGLYARGIRRGRAHQPWKYRAGRWWPGADGPRWPSRTHGPRPEHTYSAAMPPRGGITFTSVMPNMETV